MLDTFVTEKNGDVYLNSLRRSTLGTTIVPAKNNTPVKVPVATALNNPGMSWPVPFEGPQDAYTEIFGLHGEHGMRAVGTGVISAVAFGAAVVGTGTLFLREILPGDTIVCLDDAGGVQTKIVAAGNPTTNINLNVTVVWGVAATNQPFIVFTPVVADAVARMRVEIKDVAWQRMLMNRPVPVAHVFGNALRPVMLSDAPLLQRNQMWIMQFYNFSLLAAGSFAPAAAARKWQIEALQRKDVAYELGAQQKRKMFVQPYWLTNDIDIAIPDIGAAQNTGTFYFTNTGDITIILKRLYGFVIAMGANPINVNETEPFLIELFETKTGRGLQNQPFSLNTGFGNGQFPFTLPCPLVLDPKAQIKARVTTNYTGFPGPLVPMEIALTFDGWAVLTNTTAVTDRRLLEESRRLYRRASDPMLDLVTNCREPR